VALAAGLRLPQHLAPGFEIELGRGRIGHVARHAVAMDDGDFRALPLGMRREVDGSAIQGLRPDVVVPIEQDGDVVGLLSVGGVRARHGQEKRLLMMVADLTAVAMAHVARLRAVDDLAHLDGLTGVWNERRFQDRLDAEVRKAEAERRPLSLLILDVDHFRAYNEANGHLEGDDVLRKLGHLLKTSVREDDVVARHGGADFVVLYPGASKTLALRLANTLRHAVESFPFPHRSGQPQGRLTVSGGVATYPEDAGTGGDLVRCADQARCDAKASGRNRVVAAVAFEIA
jgi:diguanylate cyclase (GGDEF)-like protein